MMRTQEEKGPGPLLGTRAAPQGPGRTREAEEGTVTFTYKGLEALGKPQVTQQRLGEEVYLGAAG